MQIGVLGATGFIGRHVVAELNRRGHAVCPIGRDKAHLDLLAGLDGVVIAAGVLSGPDLTDVHGDLPRRVANAARSHDIRHLVLVSAIGASPRARTAFLRSKAEGEGAVLQARLPGWTIVRPSLVYGPGGISMRFLAALAALPIRVRMDSGPIRPILVDDLAAAIADLLAQTAPLPEAVDAVGPDRVGLDDYLDALGHWLSVRPLFTMQLPLAKIRKALARGPNLNVPLLAPDALSMLADGADGDPQPLRRFTDVRPSDLQTGLGRHPATTGDRIEALLGPWPTCLNVSLALLWIGSGVASLTNLGEGLALLHQAGIEGPLAIGLIVAGAGWDLTLGMAAFGRRFRQPAIVAQAASILLYTAIATALLPSAWSDPLGRLLKNIPLLFATLLLVSFNRGFRRG